MKLVFSAKCFEGYLRKLSSTNFLKILFRQVFFFFFFFLSWAYFELWVGWSVFIPEASKCDIMDLRSIVSHLNALCMCVCVCVPACLIWFNARSTHLGSFISPSLSGDCQISLSCINLELNFNVPLLRMSWRQSLAIFLCSVFWVILI